MAALPEPWKSLRAAIERLTERIRSLENRSPFFGTGMHTNGTGGIDSDNFVAGATGYSFKSDGNAEFNDLTLRGGIIGNDALTNPVVPAVYKLVASNFGLTTSFVEKDGVDITVPAGFTRLAIGLFGRMYSLNPNTTGGGDGSGTDALYVRVSIGANDSTATPTGISGSGGFATTNTFDAFNLSGLVPGSVLRFSVKGSSGYQSIASNVDNYISAVAQVTWLR